MPSGHPGHQGSRMPGSSWYHIVYSCPSFFLTHPSRRYGILILKFIVTFKRAGKANPWRRLSLLNKQYNNYWWPNAVALALEGIHNPVEVLNKTARYKHYSKTYYLSPPPPPPTRVRQGGGPRPLGILVLPPILCRRLAFCYCGSYKKVWNVLCYYLSCSLVHVHSSFIAISLLDKTGGNKMHYGQGENG